MTVVAALSNLRLIWRDVSFLLEKKKAIIHPNCCCDFVIHHSGSLFLPAWDLLLLQKPGSGVAGEQWEHLTGILCSQPEQGGR